MSTVEWSLIQNLSSAESNANITNICGLIIYRIQTKLHNDKNFIIWVINIDLIYKIILKLMTISIMGKNVLEMLTATVRRATKRSNARFIWVPL